MHSLRGTQIADHRWVREALVEGILSLIWSDLIQTDCCDGLPVLLGRGNPPRVRPALSGNPSSELVLHPLSEVAFLKGHDISCLCIIGDNSSKPCDQVGKRGQVRNLVNAFLKDTGLLLTLSNVAAASLTCKKRVLLFEQGCSLRGGEAFCQNLDVNLLLKR